ncbi:gamma-glutamylcyclotransferase family protein [Pelagicoccus mobilis]|uniref:Gamma-glutamylcyclotransferase n=1 Tax=Pelagicoccus mobilis TaxID=415221 RepID=A0A934S3M7_9BACT|nr:gamma-glutamylcyclotransferase family protein [Pelagicoccus mobilis]MBK1880590.1 gamma-glutamylcyclotransferase [Pelagicoccus mobilis]
MSSQYLFAYGTLKSDQPEHPQHCLPPLSITPAKALGTLWRLREGYPILQVDPSAALLDASKDPLDDWQTALDQQTTAPTTPTEGQKWIEGELFEYPLAPNALDKMDTWENFTPGIKSPYQRRVIWTKDQDGNDRLAWAYVCYSPPNWSTMLTQTRW